MAQTLIDYFPNFDRHASRTIKIKAANEQDGLMCLPEGFPARIESAMTWSGKSLKIEDWMFVLTDSHLEEVEQALRRFQGMGSRMMYYSS